MDQRLLSPHVLIFPFPAPSHLNAMLKLAELLSLAGNIHVTFLNSDYNHSRLLQHSDALARFSRYPQFRFETISDGLPVDHPRSGDRALDLIDSIETVTKPSFREMLISGRLGSDTSRPPLTCVIADGMMSFGIDVAKEIGVMGIAFRMSSACYLWTNFCIPQVIQTAQLPCKGNGMDEPVTCVPGMEDFLRRRDLPSYCRVNDPTDQILQFFVKVVFKSSCADVFLLNTFEDLEAPILSHLRSHFPKLYTIGPLHTHLKTRLVTETTSSQSSNSLWQEDRNCMKWLDAKPLKSVIYVSFGSLTAVTREEMMEFWYGLVNSKKFFLWVIRPDSVIEKEESHQIPAELLEGTKERGYMLGWAPQEEVLAHRAVGGFFTHSGWNSTLESIVAGVPMICWPYLGDQHVISRFVSEAWKIGLDMKDRCDRVTVQNMVNEVMEVRKEEFIRSAEMMANLARRSVSEGGSSYCNLDRLIEDIRSIGMQAANS